MANTFAFPTWTTLECLRTLKNKLGVAAAFNTDANNEYRRPFAVGDTINVKKPQRFTVRTGQTYSAQDINRKTTPVVLDQIFGIDFSFDDYEKALKMERSREEIKAQYLDPAMEQLAQEIDSRAALFAYQNCPNIAGILGTEPTTTAIAQSALTKLIRNGCPAGTKELFLTPGMQESIVNGSTSLFNDQAQLSKGFKEGLFSRSRGFDWYTSMSLYQHTAGTWAGAVTVNGANQTGTTLNVTCTTGDTFKKGDVFSIANVNEVNPTTRRSTGVVRTFVITADATGASSAAALSIYPPIYGPSGANAQYQTVDALAANTAALTLFPGTTSPSAKVGFNSLALHRDAFMMCWVPLELPKQSSVEVAQQMTDPDTGISIRFTRQWDITTSTYRNRFDVLMGFGNGYPEACAVRLLGA